MLGRATFWFSALFEEFPNTLYTNKRDAFEASRSIVLDGFGIERNEILHLNAEATITQSGIGQLMSDKLQPCRCATTN